MSRTAAAVPILLHACVCVARTAVHVAKLSVPKLLYNLLFALWLAITHRQIMEIRDAIREDRCCQVRPQGY
jgi:hypothetical protein